MVSLWDWLKCIFAKGHDDEFVCNYYKGNDLGCSAWRCKRCGRIEYKEYIFHG